MVEYDAKSWISVLSRTRGSVLARTALPVLLVAAIGVLAIWLHRQHG